LNAQELDAVKEKYLRYLNPLLGFGTHLKHFRKSLTGRIYNGN